jgi:hypothetical protein
MHDFNPFDKAIQDLTLSDIESLKTKGVAEGLFVEYKSAFPSSIKVSRSVASFANSHGGWYIIGVQTGADNIPQCCDGLDLASAPNPKEKFRDIVASHINPAPLFFSTLIHVNASRAILVASIPQSPEPPHLTKDGRVYRRLGEASEPLPETDRYAIDRLYERSARFEESVDHFCQNPIVLSKAEDQAGWLEIYLMTYPIGKLFIDDLVKRKKMDSIKANLDTPTLVKSLSRIGEMTGNVPFNNISTSANSIIFRQTTLEDLPFQTLTFEFFMNGNSRIVIPFPYVSILGSGTSQNAKFLLHSLGKNPNLFRIIDGFKLFLTFHLILNKYQELLEAEQWSDQLIMKYRVRGCWRHVLFFDSDAFTTHVRTYGAPISQRDEIDIPDFAFRPWFTEPFSQFAEGQLSTFATIAAALGLQIDSLVEVLLHGLQSIPKKPADGRRTVEPDQPLSTSQNRPPRDPG